MLSVTLDHGPSSSRIFTRPRSSGVVFYIEVRELGVLVVPALSNPGDPRGTLSPQSAKLLSAKVLDRLEAQQTPLPSPPSDPIPSGRKGRKGSPPAPGGPASDDVR